MISWLFFHALLLGQLAPIGQAVVDKDAYVCAMKRVDPVNYGNPSNPNLIEPAVLVSFAVPVSTELVVKEQAVEIPIREVEFFEVGQVFEGRPIVEARRTMDGLIFETVKAQDSKLIFVVMGTDKPIQQVILVRSLKEERGNPFAYFFQGGCRKFGSVVEMRADMERHSK